MRSPCTRTRVAPFATRREKPAQQRRPGTAKNTFFFFFLKKKTNQWLLEVGDSWGGCPGGGICPGSASAAESPASTRVMQWQADILSQHHLGNCPKATAEEQTGQKVLGKLCQEVRLKLILNVSDHIQRKFTQWKKSVGMT